MEARYEILGKFCTNHQFASSRHSHMEQPNILNFQQLILTMSNSTRNSLSTYTTEERHL